MGSPATSSGRNRDAVPTVADHVLMRRIGSGAYGEIWLAKNVMGVSRAVKVVWRDRFEHEKIYEREFTGVQHFEPVSRLHPGMINVLQVGRSTGLDYFYYVMELADPEEGSGGGSGEPYAPLTLERMLRRRGALPVADSVRIGAALADALAFLHRNGLVHRDIKPANIIFVGGQPKLADIGLVAGFDSARSFVGTEGFIPPEGPGTPQADLFSLGKVLYEMATGRNRLDFPDLPADWQNQREPGIFRELNETILRACALEAAERHVSAEDLRNELLLIESGRSVRRIRRNERILRRWRRLGFAAALLGAIGLGVGWFARDQLERASLRAAHESMLREEIQARELETRQTLYAADMNLVQQAVDAGNFGRAKELLAAYLPDGKGSDFRGFEWFHFWDRVQGASLGVMRGHAGVIPSMIVSQDGRRLYSAGFDGTLREWCLEAMRELRQWAWPGSAILSLSLHPDGTRLAVEKDRPRSIALLDLNEGSWISHPSTGAPRVTFCPSGARLLRGDGIILFETGAGLEIIDTGTWKIDRMDEAGGRAWFSPDGRLLVTGPWGDTLRFWSWPELSHMGDLETAGTVMGVAFSPDGSTLAAVLREGNVQWWGIADRKKLAEKRAHEHSVIWSAAYSPDGKMLATAGNDQTVRLWDAEQFEEKQVFRGHGSEVWKVVWSPDGKRVISSGKDGTIRVWDASPDLVPFRLDDVAQAPVFSQDDRWMGVRTRSGAMVMEAATGREILNLGPTIELGGFTEHGNISLLRAGNRIEIWSVAEGHFIEARAVPLDRENATVRMLSPSGRWLATGTDDGSIWISDSLSGEPPKLLSGHDQRIFSLAISPDERWLLSGSRDLTARLWEIESGRESGEFRGHRMSVSALAFAPDGVRIATGSWDDMVFVWDRSSGERLSVYGGHSASVHAVEFAPDGRTLAVLSGASGLTFWHLATGREAGSFQLEQGTGMGRLRFSPQGRWMAAVTPPGGLVLLEAPRPEHPNRSNSR